MPRPSKLTAVVVPRELSRADQVHQVCEFMRDGKACRIGCAEVGIAEGTFFRWLEADGSLMEQYTRARARLLDIKAEELEEIGERAERAETAVEVAGLRLLSDNRKWLLSKLAPKKYGEKIAIGGADDLPAIKSQTGLSDDALLAIATKAVA